MVDAKRTRDVSSTAELSCPSCGVPLPAGLSVCWLCFSSVDATKDQVKVEQPQSVAKPSGTPADQAGGFSLASLMMFVTLVCVVLGVFTIAPGLGVPLAIVTFVTWLRTVSVVKWRACTGSSLTSTEIILIFMRSVAFTLLILVLVGVAAVAAFAALCFGAISTAGPSDLAFTGVAVVSLVVLIVAIFGLVAATRFERRRWRRDHHGPK